MEIISKLALLGAGRINNNLPITIRIANAAEYSRILVMSETPPEFNERF